MSNLQLLKRALPIALVLVLGACGDEQDANSEAPAPEEPSNSVPVIDGSPVTKAVVGEIYEFVPAATDADEDVLTFAIQNRPGWAAFSPSTGRLSGRPPSSAASRIYADILISVSDSKAVAELPAYDLEVEADPDANTVPTISGSPETTATVGNSYSFTPDTSDPDGQVLSFSIDNPPAWTSFDTLTGQLSGTPANDDVGTFAGIVISVSDGAASRSLPAFDLTVSAGAPPPPVNRAPVISGSPAQAATVGELYSFQPMASDPDGQALSFSISDKPGWANFSTATGRLRGTPGSADVGEHRNIVISVTDGAATTSLPAFAITVVAANAAPQIGGTPATSVTVGQAYSFQPTASDPDGQTLTFSISGRPGWATFNTQTGRLLGTPADNHVGSHNNIQISVTDGIAVRSLPAFSIRVDAATNRAPVISGTPPAAVSVDEAYDFRPTASDADGDSLSFSITNRPSWASFDPVSGRLWGTPTAQHAGAYSGIRISVSDGTATVSLPQFTITVQQIQLGSATLSWTPPTENEDGTPLTNLRGFRIYYGQNSSALGTMIETPNAGITTAMVENLSPATWYFAVKAYTTDGVESAFSNVASKRID